MQMVRFVYGLDLSLIKGTDRLGKNILHVV